MQLELSVEKYTLREAADAAGFQINTLRSLYGRGHFRIVGGEDKKGRGLAALLTYEDVMCIAVARVLIDAHVHPKVAFQAGHDFAYTSAGAVGPHTGYRLPSQTFAADDTVLICHPGTGDSKIINASGGVPLDDLFIVSDSGERQAAVCASLDDVESSVRSKLKN